MDGKIELSDGLVLYVAMAKRRQVSKISSLTVNNHSVEKVFLIIQHTITLLFPTHIYIN